MTTAARARDQTSTPGDCARNARKKRSAAFDKFPIMPLTLDVPPQRHLQHPPATLLLHASPLAYFLTLRGEASPIVFAIASGLCVLRRRTIAVALKVCEEILPGSPASLALLLIIA